MQKKYAADLLCFFNYLLLPTDSLQIPSNMLVKRQTNLSMGGRQVGVEVEVEGEGRPPGGCNAWKAGPLPASKHSSWMATNSLQHMCQ